MTGQGEPLVMARPRSAGWHRLPLALRFSLGVTGLGVTILALPWGLTRFGADRMAAGAPWVIVGLGGVLAWLWLRPLEEVVGAAQRLVAGHEELPPRGGDRAALRLLARVVDEAGQQLELSRRQLEQRNRELEKANEVLEQLSITDGLTRLHNHRHFQDQYRREARRSARTGHPLCVGLVDIDDFKSLNDAFGHSVGDQVLATVARVLSDATREMDYLARYGGEEFALLLPETSLDAALHIGERIRAAVADAPLPDPGATDDPLRISVSVGLAAFDGDTRRTFDAADRALYRAKARGKDCVVVAETRLP